MTANAAAIYARYSTDMQDPSSVEDQLALGDRVAAEKGLWVSQERKFDDAALSGGSVHKRTGFKRMMAAARRGEFKFLLIEKMGRLSRDSADVQSVLREFRFLRIEIIECATGQKLDKISATVKGLAADLNREDIAQHVRRGLDGIVRRGNSAGGRAYGYRSVPRLLNEKGRGGILEIAEDEAEIVREIFFRYAAGETPRSIAADLNRRGIPSPRGKHWQASCINGMKARGTGILNNQLYNGVRVWNKVEMVEDPSTGNRVSRVNPPEALVVTEVEHLRIVTADLWAKVQEKRAQTAVARPQDARAPHRLFSGLLRCGVCGKGMTSKGPDSTGRVRVSCAGAKESGICADPRSYYVDEVEQRVLALLRQELIQPDVIRAFIDEYEAEMKRLRASAAGERQGLERELKRASTKATHLNTLLMNGMGDMNRINAELQPLLAKERELRARLDLMEQPSIVVLHPASRERYVRAVASLHETLARDATTEGAQIVREVVEKIGLHPTGPTKNRHTAPPKIELVGRLEALMGQRFILPSLRDFDGSGGGT